MARILGSFLLLTATLKIVGFEDFAYSGIGFFLDPWLLTLFIELEIVLALWLLSGWYRVASYFFATLTFAGFALASFYLGWIGVKSCGCLGAIKTSPWLTFTVDIVVLVALQVFRPNMKEFFKGPSSRTTIVAPTMGLMIFVIVGIIGWLAHQSFEPIEGLFAHLRGDRLTARPGLVRIAPGTTGDKTIATIEVVNWTNRDIRIVGGSSDCNCVATQDLPIIVQPHRAQPIQIIFTYGRTAGFFSRKVWLMTDDPQRFINLRVLGRTILPNGEQTLSSIGNKDDSS